MADFWIKVEKCTPDKPEILEMAADLGIEDPDTVMGKLIRVWSWFDSNSEKGHAPSVTIVLLDRLTGVRGFSEAMIKVGWMKKNSDGSIIVPHYDRHLGKGAKKRASDSERKRVQREKEKALSAKSHGECHTESVTGSGQTLGQNRDQSRVDKIRKDLKDQNKGQPKIENPDFQLPDGLNLDAWNEWKAYRRETKLKAYKPTARGEGAAARNLIVLSGGNLQTQMWIVQQSIANQWSGLFELKPRTKPNTHNLNGIDYGQSGKL